MDNESLISKSTVMQTEIIEMNCYPIRSDFEIAWHCDCHLNSDMMYKFKYT